MSLVLVDNMGESLGVVGIGTGVYAKDKYTENSKTEICIGDYVQFNGTGLLSFTENQKGIVCEYDGHMTIMGVVSSDLKNFEIIQVIKSHKAIGEKDIKYLSGDMLRFGLESNNERKHSKQEFLKDETDGNFTGLCHNCGSTDVTINLGFVEESMKDLLGFSYPAQTAYMNVECIECHNRWSVYCGKLWGSNNNKSYE